ncbi:MAG: zf-TFIIB domain-containing protein [Bdellovibrio sp.]|nr:zf-TFIIB domain-containing protein [Bdellovibrio sp.]
MKCPHCSSEMELRLARTQRVVLDECRTCKGIWLDVREIDFFIKDKTLLQSYYRNGLAHTSLSERICPKCQKKMMTGNLPNFETPIEACQSCHGLFLDNGELYAIIQSATEPMRQGLLRPNTIRNKKDLPVFFKRIFDADEEVIFAEAPNLGSYFFSLSLALLLAFGTLYGFHIFQKYIFKMELPEQLVMVETLNYIFAGFFVIYAIASFLQFRNTYYCLTNKRFIGRSGIFGIDFVSVDYSQVTDLQLRVGMLDRILGSGSVYIQTASDASYLPRIGRFHPYKIFSVADPYSVFKLVKSLCYKQVPRA